MRVYREQGKPAAAVAVLAGIFTTALVIKMLPPSTRDASTPVTSRQMPSRALLVWMTSPPFTYAVPPPVPPPLRHAPVATSVSIGSTTQEAGAPVEALAGLSLTFDLDPGELPPLDAITLMSAALPMHVVPEPAGTEDSGSPLVTPFAKTGCALRVALTKTGSAIKAAVR